MDDREGRIGYWISGVAHGSLILWAILGGALFRPQPDHPVRTTQVSTVSGAEFEAMAAAARGAGPVGAEATAVASLPDPVDPSEDGAARPVDAMPPQTGAAASLQQPDAAETTPDLGDFAPASPVDVASDLPTPSENQTASAEVFPDLPSPPAAPLAEAQPDQPAPPAADAAAVPVAPRSALALEASPRPQDRPSGLVETFNRRVAEAVAAEAALAAQQAAAEAQQQAAAQAARAEAAEAAEAERQAAANAAAEAERQAAAEAAEAERQAAAEAQQDAAAEAARQAAAAEAEAEQQAAAEAAEAERQAAAEAARRAAAAEAEREAEADRQAAAAEAEREAAEAERQAAAEAERQAEEARRAAVAEAERRAEAERQAAVEAERVAEEERRAAAADAERQAAAEAERRAEAEQAAREAAARQALEDALRDAQAGSAGQDTASSGDAFGGNTQMIEGGSGASAGLDPLAAALAGAMAGTGAAADPANDPAGPPADMMRLTPGPMDAISATPLDDAASGLPMGEPLTFSEREGLRFAIQNCWNLGMLNVEAAQMTVSVGFSLSPNGVPDAESLRIAGYRNGSESAAQQAFEVARRAILSCGRAGFDLPASKYGRWRDVVVDFRPDGIEIPQ